MILKEDNNLPVQFNERIHATSIDYGVVFLSVIIVIFMQWEVMYKYLVILVVWYFMNVFPSFFKRGITLGKINSGTIVVDMSNNKVSLIKIHLRSFFILICGFLTAGLYFIIAFILLNRRTDKRSIHDLIFKTKVVYKKTRISG